MKALKVFVAVLVLSCARPSQSQPSPVPFDCAQPREDVAVRLDSSQHTIQQPEPGKALIYFIQDTDQPVFFADPSASVGIDGKWVGASTNGSYFVVAVEPGWHSLCTGDMEFDHLVAEPGMVYYFRVRPFLSDSGSEFITLVPIDSEEASNLIAIYPRATATLQAMDRRGRRALRSGLAAGQQQLQPGPQMALNGGAAKETRSRSQKDHPSKPRQDSAAPQKKIHDTSNHATETSTRRRTG